MQPIDTPIAHPQAVLHEEFDDWTLLFQPLTGEAVGVGPVGVAIWKRLDGRRTLAEIAAEIAAQCGAPQETVLADTLTFLNDLERRLLVLAEPLAQPAPPPRVVPRPAPEAGLAQGPSQALSLADGTRLALHAADETAARVVAFLAEKARLLPVQAPLPPDARRLVAVTGIARDDGHHLQTTSPVSGAPGDVICILEPPDVQRHRLRRRGRAKRGVVTLAPEPLTEEQWLWQQLVRLSACIGRETLSRGGVLLHSGLAACPDLSGFGNLTGLRGILLAGRSGVGKSTASRRLPPPWRALADDVTLVVRDPDGAHWAHPWPTWSRFFGDERGDGRDAWDVQRAVPLRAILVLEQGDEDRAGPLGPGHAVALLAELARQAFRHFLRGQPLAEIAAFHRQCFANLCALVRAVPAYQLDVSLDGAFWQEIEAILAADQVP